MADILLSEAERTFTLHGIQDNVRVDGRGCDDYRHLEIETEVVSNAHGSSRVRLANTDILVGVKAEMGEPLPTAPAEGRVEFFLDCSANATPKFEGRGGEALATEITNMMYRAFSNNTVLDLKSLCLHERKTCWVLYVDILILELGGNVFDIVSIATKAALFNTKLPNVKVSCNESGETELDLADDPYDVKRVDVTRVPCLVTLNKIGHHHVVDASMEEEACTLARLVMGVCEDGTISAFRKEGGGSLDPNSIYDMIETGKRVGQNLNKALLKKLQEEDQLGSKKQLMGFLR